MAEDRVEQLEKCLLEVYALLGSWVKTGHTNGYGTWAPERAKFQDWLKAVDAAFTDGEVHRDFGEDPCPTKFENGYRAVWCAKATKPLLIPRKQPALHASNNSASRSAPAPMTR